MRKDLWLAIAAAALLFTAGSAHAQEIRWSEYDRAVAPGAYIPYEGMNYQTQYGYYSGPAFSFNVCRNRSQFDYLDYLDRVDRALKFGYRIPPPPPGYAPVWTPRP